MVKHEFYRVREDGVNLYINYSDKKVYIINDQTGGEHSEAIDIEDVSYTYSETDRSIDPDDQQESPELNFDENNNDN